MRARSLFIAPAALAVALLAACGDDNNPVDPGIQPGSTDITGDILVDRTLYAETTYTIRGFVHVANGATLTIQPGTRILGDFGTLGSSLFVLRGARIVAVGTADDPIVFTSSQPVGSRAPGDWGGLVIVGNGVVNRAGDLEIEGTNTSVGSAPGTNYRVLYSGGADNGDSSGELRYVRVEFAGFAPALNKELNSFSFAAVGSGTRVSYLQALAGLDDAFEFWGGAVDADHLVSYDTGDDHFDMSEGFVGRLQFIIAMQTTALTPRNGAGTPSSDPQGIENDGCDGTGCGNGYDTTPHTIPVVSNFTLVGTGSTASSGSSGGVGMMLRRGSGGYYVNGIVARWPRYGIVVRDAETFARAESSPTPSFTTADLAVKNVLFVDNAALFQTGGIHNTFDEAGNSLIVSSSATSTVFASFPASVDAATTASAFDWSPSSSSPAAAGGLASFSGKLATRVATATASGNVIAGTAYLGAAAPTGGKWWQGWTTYARN